MNRIQDVEPESVAVVELLVRKGADANLVCHGKSPLELALNWEQPFEQKKAKVAALLDAGVHVDWNMVQEAIEKGLQVADIVEKRGGHWPAAVLTREEWKQLAEVVVDKTESGREFPGILHFLMREYLPVDGVIDLVGRYAHPYFDYKDQQVE
jgi:hypothetical protein